MNRILFPTDFSICADQAQTVAIALAKKFDAELHIVHVVNDTIFKWKSEEHISELSNVLPVDSSSSTVRIIKNGLEDLESLMQRKRAVAKLEGIKVVSKVLFGEAHKEILQYSTETEPNLIVMGTNGVSGIRQEFTGSKTQWINRYAKRPVLSIRFSDKDQSEFKNILYVSDFREDISIENLKIVAVFANLTGAEVQLLYVNTPTYFEETEISLDRMRDAAKLAGINEKNINVYGHRYVEQGVLAFAKQNNHDLIAITSHGYQGLKRLTEFQTTELLINHAQIPVLSMHIE